MTIVITNAPTATDQLPTIIYDNLFSSGTLTASSEDVGFSKENVRSENTVKSWKPTTLPATLTIDKTVPVTADCFTLVAHSCGTKGNSIILESSTDNVTWTLRSLVSPNDNTTVLGLFTSVSARYWRLRLVSKNRLIQTEVFDDAVWVKTRVTVTANATTSPVVTLTADKLIETAAASTHFIQQTITGVTADTVHTFTVYVKGAERTNGVVRIDNGANFIIGGFQLASGTITPSVGGTGVLNGVSIQAVGNDWWRVQVSGIPAPAVTTWDCSIYLRDGSNASSYTGDGTSGLFIWGAQFEQGVIPTNYFNVGASFTGNTPNVAVAMLSQRFNFPAGVKPPYVPVWLSQDFDLLTGSTMGGQFLGNRVLRKGGKTSISLVALETGFVNNNLTSFREHYNSGKAFVWASSPAIFDKDVGYVWRTENAVMSPTFDDNGNWMSTSMEVYSYGE